MGLEFQQILADAPRPETHERGEQGCHPDAEGAPGGCRQCAGGEHGRGGQHGAPRPSSACCGLSHPMRHHLPYPNLCSPRNGSSAIRGRMAGSGWDISCSTDWARPARLAE